MVAFGVNDNNGVNGNNILGARDVWGRDTLGNENKLAPSIIAVSCVFLRKVPVEFPTVHFKEI